MDAIISCSSQVISWSNIEPGAEWHNIIAVAKKKQMLFKNTGHRILDTLMQRGGKNTCLYYLDLCVCDICGCWKLFPILSFFPILTLCLYIASQLEQLLFSPSWEGEKKEGKSRTTVLQAKQTVNPPLWHCPDIKKKEKTKEKAWADLRFTGVAICMLRPINFSWLSHYEHSQPEGGNAKLICVLKLLSQAGITGKCSDYPLGTGEGHVV